jgi:hypothetical protein
MKTDNKRKYRIESKTENRFGKNYTFYKVINPYGICETFFGNDDKRFQEHLFWAEKYVADKNKELQ